MTFLVGELATEIRLAGKEQYARDLQASGMLTGKLAADTKALTGAMQTGFRTAAGVITAATVAGTALGVSLFKTGAAYNTLQQTSRAALSTLLGGAEAANAQMDKLDQFARTSPFAKGVFISAQQQLLGFGMAAEKVIPTLDAVQNAVAATGGSSQSLSEITFVLAQIQAAGKITATDLMQLGQRGVDAASIIGSQMGLTGAEIREKITEGSLGAQEALDALTAGLSAKFGGAAANVKQTWAGTVDRIKAGSREIGAAIAEPFIAQNGGGMAVQWGNQVADVLQGIRGHARPVVAILTGELQPAFAGITNTLDRANVVVRSWDSTRLQQFLDAAGGYAPGVAALAGAIVASNASMLSGIPVLGRFIPAINPLAAALIAAAAASPDVRDGAREVLAALQPLLPVAGDLAKVLASGLNIAAPIAADGLRLLANVAEPVVGILSSIPAPVLASVAGFLAMQSALGPLAPSIKAAFEGLRGIAEQVAVQAALAAMEGHTSKFAGALGLASIGARTLGESIKAAFISNPLGLILLGVSTAVGILTAAFAEQAEEAKETQENVQAYRTTLDRTTGSVTAATREMVAAKVATDEWSGRLKSAGVNSALFVDALTGVRGAADGVRESVIRTTREGMLDTTFQKASDLARKLGTDVDTVIAATLGFGDAQDVVSDKIKAAGVAGYTYGATFDQLSTKVESFAGDAQSVAGYLQEQESALADARREQEQYNEALRIAQSEMSEAARSNQRLNDALTIARDVTRDATERLNALKQALDELNGGTKTQADLTRDLNEQALNLADAFGVTDENGNRLATSLVNASGVIDQTSRAGINLYDQTSRLNDAMLDAILAEDKLAKSRGETGISTERAAQVAQPYIDQLRTIATDAGLSAEQVDGLVSTMLATPQVVAFLIDDNGTVDEKKQELIVLAQQILATPDKSFSVRSDDFPGLRAALEALGAQIITLPDGTVKVQKDDGSFLTLERALNEATRSRTVKVYADGSGFSIGGRQVTPGSANGNMFEKAKAKAKAYANGGFPTGIYTGGMPLYKFAEQETGWEAFISGRKGQEARNLAIASDAVGRLGGMVITPEQLRQGVSGAQGASHVDNSLHLALQSAPGVALPPIHEVMSLVRRLEARQARKG